MQNDFPLLEELLLLLLTAIPIVFICSQARISVIVGLMITGIVIGPFGLGLIHDVFVKEKARQVIMKKRVS